VTGEVTPQQQAFLAARLEKSLSPEPGQSRTNSLGMKFVSARFRADRGLETRVQDYDAFFAAQPDVATIRRISRKARRIRW